jgi:hypothetical protein
MLHGWQSTYYTGMGVGVKPPAAATTATATNLVHIGGSGGNDTSWAAAAAAAMERGGTQPFHQMGSNYCSLPHPSNHN